MQELRCKKCGLPLYEENGVCVCPGCGTRYSAERAQLFSEEMFRLLDEQKQERVANLRVQLWKEFNEEFYDRTEIARLAKGILNYLPDDFFATFCDLACEKNPRKLNDFLFRADVEKEGMFVWDMLAFLMRPLREETLLAVNDLLSRAGEAQLDAERFRRFNTRLSEESKKLNSGVYDVTLPRDVFVAYSSADMAEVGRLVEVLEQQSLTCFVAARNLQHGAMQNYNEQLEKAMDHCKTFVFVSSCHSRSRTCDALRIELSYIQQKDIAAAPQFRNNYPAMPAQYKKPRVEYLLEQHTDSAADKIVEEFFEGYEYCFADPDETAERILRFIASRTPTVKYCVACGTENRAQARFCYACGKTDFVETRALYEEAARKRREQESHEAEMARFLEEQRRRAEEEQRRIEEEKRRAEEEAQALRAELERLKAIAEGRQSAAAAEPDDGQNRPRRAQGEVLSVPQEGEAPSPAQEPSAPSGPPVQSAPPAAAKSVVRSSNPLKDFKIKDSELIKYTGRDSVVVIPDGVTRIGAYAFTEKDTLTKIVLSEGVKVIAQNAFTDCANLSEIVFCADVLNVEADAFSGCPSVNTIRVEEGNRTYSSEGNCLIDIRTKTLVLACNASVLPDDGSISVIGTSAFCNCKALHEIVLPRGITSIEARAFSGCSSLQKIQLPPELVTIEDNAFVNTALEEVVLPEGVTKLGEYVFEYCAGLTEVVLPESLLTIGDGAFCGCFRLRGITIPGSVARVPKDAFSGCEGLTCVTLKEGVKRIGENAFDGCKNLTEVVFPASITNIAKTAFRRCPKLTLPEAEPPAAEVRSQASAQKSVSQTQTASDFLISNGILEKYRGAGGIVTVPRGVGRIGYRAFEGCQTLTKLILPEGVKAIGFKAFCDCSRLTSVQFPESLCTLESDAFASCTSLKELVIPQLVQTIDVSAFFNCASLESITVARGNTRYFSGGNCLIDRMSGCLMLGCSRSVIPESSSVTSIGKAFYGCKNLTEITIPANIIEIAYGAFRHCASLERIVVEDDNPVYHSSGNCVIHTKEKEVVVGCKNSVLPVDGSVTSIGKYAFYGCAQLTNLVIPDSVTRIGTHAFSACTQLSSLVLPNGMRRIDSFAFAGSTNLHVVIPATLETMGTNVCGIGATLYCRKRLLFWPKGWDRSNKDRIVWGK